MSVIKDGCEVALAAAGVGFMADVAAMESTGVTTPDFSVVLSAGAPAVAF